MLLLMLLLLEKFRQLQLSEENTNCIIPLKANKDEHNLPLLGLEGLTPARHGPRPFYWESYMRFLKRSIASWVWV